MPLVVIGGGLPAGAGWLSSRGRWIFPGIGKIAARLHEPCDGRLTSRTPRSDVDDSALQGSSSRQMKEPGLRVPEICAVWHLHSPSGMALCADVLQDSRKRDCRFMILRAWWLLSALGIVVFATAGSAGRQAGPLESRLREYDADVPKTIVELQQFRETHSIRITSKPGREGTATLVNLNPSINAWYLLEVTWNDGAPARTYHLENPHPHDRTLLLDEKYPFGLVIAGGRRSVFLRSVLSCAAGPPGTRPRLATHLLSLVRVTALSAKPCGGAPHGAGGGNRLRSGARLGWGRGDCPGSSSDGRCKPRDWNAPPRCAGRHTGSERTGGRARWRP